MEVNKKSNRVKTGIFRLSFPALFEPKAGPEGGKEKYSITMLFPKSDQKSLNILRKAAYDEIVRKWGQDRTKWPANLRAMDFRTYLSITGKDGWPFRDGDAQTLDGYAGMVSIKASSNEPPGVVDQRVQPVQDAGEVYAGCYCRATIVPFVFDKPINKGVSFGLRNVQFVKDGQPFSGRTRPEDDFDVIEDDAELEGWDNPANYTPGAGEDMFA
jgi:hypothetical protein